MTKTSSCPDVAALENFTLGKTAEPVADDLQHHLATCPACVETMHGLGATDTLIAAMKAVEDAAAPPVPQELLDTAVRSAKELVETVLVSKGRRPAPDLTFLDPPLHEGDLGAFAGFRITKLLGAGGMGIVLAGEDVKLSRAVALKILHPQMAVQDSARQRFLREARAVAKVQHEQIVSIFHIGEHKGLPFFAMPLLEGQSLEARLEQGRLTADEVADIGIQIARGLAAAHERGLVHRDIKPANVFLSSDGKVQLLDFGLARLTDDQVPLTQTGMLVGTPLYMSPEQAEAEPIDSRSDLFSLGSLLYALAAGQPPFRASTCLGVLRAVVQDSPRALREVNPTIPPGLEDIVMTLLAKKPAQRIQSACQVALALDDWRRSGSTTIGSAATTSIPVKVRRVPGWLIAACLLIGLPVVGLGVTEAMGITHLFSSAPTPANPATPFVAADDGSNQAQNGKKETPPKSGEEAPAPNQVAVVQPDKEDKPAAPAVYPAALFPFEDRSGKSATSELSGKVTDLIFARLAVKPDITLVDRADLKKILSELELNLSGAVKESEATRVGRLTGAKLMITGSIIQLDKKIYIVGKVIGTETSRVIADSVDGKASDELAPLIEKLADKLADKIKEQADKLVAAPVKTTDRIAALKNKIKKGDKPVLLIQVAERHIGGAKIDPAVQTELMKIAKECGFEVLDPEEGLKSKADVIVKGEGLSEFQARNGNLVSVKARVEIKATERKTDRILVADRQTALVVDLSEQLAGKAALQDAAVTLAERLLPQLGK